MIRDAEYYAKRNGKINKRLCCAEQGFHSTTRTATSHMDLTSRLSRWLFSSGDDDDQAAGPVPLPTAAAIPAQIDNRPANNDDRPARPPGWPCSYCASPEAAVLDHICNQDLMLPPAQELLPATSGAPWACPQCTFLPVKVLQSTLQLRTGCS